MSSISAVLGPLASISTLKYDRVGVVHDNFHLPWRMS